MMGSSGDLTPVLDLEETGGLAPSQLVAWVHNWLDTNFAPRVGGLALLGA